MPSSPQYRSSSPIRLQESRPGATPSGWHSCHIPSFTSAFGFPSSPSGSKPKRETELMETEEAEDHINVQGTGICVRHERLRVDYKRLRQRETDHHERSEGSASALPSEASEQDANLKEVRYSGLPAELTERTISSRLTNPLTHLLRSCLPFLRQIRTMMTLWPAKYKGLSKHSPKLPTRRAHSYFTDSSAHAATPNSPSCAKT